MTRDLPLPPRLDFASVDALHAALRDAQGADITLDGSGVTHLGSCGLQLLISAAKTWDRDGHSLRVVNPSDRFIDHLTTLGLAPDAFGRAGGLS